MRSCLFVFVLAAATTVSAAQSPAAASPEARVAAFIQRLQQAISHRDVDALAAMFRFPASVHSNNLTVPIANQAALVKAFDTVFTPELGCALERSIGSGRSAADAIRREGDAVIVGRALHLQPSGDSFVITRIDEPAGAAPPAARSKPRQANVPSGQVQFAGTLAAGGADRYIVTARQGDVVQARIERFQGRAIGVRILDAGTGRVVGSGDGTTRTTSATAAGTGDLAVDVTRLTFCEPAVSYLLTISKHR